MNNVNWYYRDLAGARRLCRPAVRETQMIVKNDGRETVVATIKYDAVGDGVELITPDGTTIWRGLWGNSIETRLVSLAGYQES